MKCRARSYSARNSSYIYYVAFCERSFCCTPSREHALFFRYFRSSRCYIKEIGEAIGLRVTNPRLKARCEKSRRGANGNGSVFLVILPNDFENGRMHMAQRYNYGSYVSDTQSRMNYRKATPPARARPSTTMPAHHEQRPDCR